MGGSGRPRRLAVVGLAVVGLAVGVVAVVDACATGSAPAFRLPVVAPSGEPGEARCPATYDLAEIPRPRRDGDLVPPGARTALLCAYPLSPDPEVRPRPLGLSWRLTGPVDRLVKHLNRLAPLERPAPDTREAFVDGCSLVGYQEYQVVLGYPDGTRVTVALNRNCGRAASTGAVRQLGSLATLLRFWPDATPQGSGRYPR